MPDFRWARPIRHRNGQAVTDKRQVAGIQVQLVHKFRMFACETHSSTNAFISQSHTVRNDKAAIMEGSSSFPHSNETKD